MHGSFPTGGEMEHTHYTSQLAPRGTNHNVPGHHTGAPGPALQQVLGRDAPQSPQEMASDLIWSDIAPCWKKFLVQKYTAIGTGGANDGNVAELDRDVGKWMCNIPMARLDKNQCLLFILQSFSACEDFFFNDTLMGRSFSPKLKPVKWQKLKVWLLLLQCYIVK